MSISLMTYAFRADFGENHCAKMVLLKLADHASDDGVCWPSWAHLVKHTGYSRRSVAYALKHLEETGIIKREQRTGTSTMYTLDANAIKKHTPPALRGHDSSGYKAQEEPKVDECDDSTSAMTAPPSAMVAPTSAKAAPEGCNSCTQIIIEPSVKPKEKQAMPDAEHRKQELRLLYAEWVSHSGSETDKKAFKKYLDTVIDRYGGQSVLTAIGEYFRLLDDRRFMSVKRFAETAPAYMKKKVMRGIDPHSDMPPSEQLKHQ